MKDYTNGPAPGFFIMWWNKGALLPVALTVFVLLLTYGSYQSLKLGLAFDARGVVIEATATDRREQRVRRNDRTETDCYVTFEYRAEGAIQSVERKVDRGLYRSLVPGTPRDIRYLPERPRRMEYTIGKTWRDGQVSRWIALVFGLGALGAFWWTARPAVEALRARKFGRVEWAKVLHIDERITQTKRGKKTRYVLVWEDSQGARGESLASSLQSRYFRYDPGSDIEVYRDSRGKTWWVGDVGPRATAPTVPDAGKSVS
ncbi:hypothetical protein GCM10007385_25170 [Tateyamaria omphalii]|uniref:DUF3592 domain-containing protein n=1 Tax=Tateyamaria omphalii TaxID=299262 RepID=UPI00167887BB|nr:DUF3592 domain-containing protein [Tateyamaria omphalii]GGX55581.1 hypothetical protein GCM10007385_25170 [Tateyamaria omphalii]